jgi:hypothetical protein
MNDYFQFARWVWIITSKSDWGEVSSVILSVDVFLLISKCKNKFEWIARSIFYTIQMVCLSDAIARRLVLLVSFVQFSVSNLAVKRYSWEILNAKTHFKSLEMNEGICHKSIYMFAEVLFALIVIYSFPSCDDRERGKK